MKVGVSAAADSDEITRLRANIDNLDAILVYTLAERFERTTQIGRLKAKYNLHPTDAGRETAQSERLRRLAAEARLEPSFVEFVETFIKLIRDEVKRQHRKARDIPN